ncbi:MAG: glutamate racemase [Flavobacterium sp.]|nr:glutamate racemase [Flavobacterium sp.]
MNTKLPIGLFDSGVGGTSIWREIATLLPGEDTIYLADSKNAPYGEKTRDEIVALSIKNTEFLLNQNCKLIVVACNTATTNAIEILRARYQVPFIGIEPAIKPAVHNSTKQTVGVLATKGTLASELFSKAVETYSQTKIIEQVGRGLVRLIENGQMESDEMTNLLHTYLQPMIDADIDYLVLGCTHYPYLIPQIKKILPPHVQVIDSGVPVAKHTKKVLTEIRALSTSLKGHHRFVTNSNPQVLSNLLNNEYEIEAIDF